MSIVIYNTHESLYIKLLVMVISEEDSFSSEKKTFNNFYVGLCLLMYCLVPLQMNVFITYVIKTKWHCSSFLKCLNSIYNSNISERKKFLRRKDRGESEKIEQGN